MKPQYYILKMMYRPDVRQAGWYFTDDQGYDTRTQAPGYNALFIPNRA